LRVFLLLVIKKELVLASRKKAEIVAELRKRDFRPFPKVQKERRSYTSSSSETRCFLRR
jgi:DNA topoisomerase-2